MNITDTLHDFFKTRPAVSVAGLALDADVFRTTIYRSMNGERIKPESERRLREAMRKYGYEPDYIPSGTQSPVTAQIVPNNA